MDAGDRKITDLVEDGGAKVVVEVRVQIVDADGIYS